MLTVGGRVWRSMSGYTILWQSLFDEISKETSKEDGVHAKDPIPESFSIAHADKNWAEDIIEEINGCSIFRGRPGGGQG